MEDTEIKIVAVELKGLNDKVERGFSDIKDLIRHSTINLNEHIKEDKEAFSEINKEVAALKIDMTRFKERWLLIGSGISLVGAALIEFIVHSLK